jgi:Ni/Fe-hydrogenase 1 B-type cytochrome subunit
MIVSENQSSSSCNGAEHPFPRSYSVWDLPTRLFHWINVICVTLLAFGGLLILYGGVFEIPKAGKITLKTIHSWIGYVFAINLLLRLAWAFIGNRYARWRAILPGGRGYLAAVAASVKGLFTKSARHYLGHNPLGRLSITTMLLLLLALAISGLMLASTDLFYPPAGHWIAKWVAAPGVDPGSLVPGASEMVDKAAWDKMRAMRKPFIMVHLYGFYALMLLAFLHVVAVILAEIREGGNLISATVTGKKLLSGPPEDAE